jgi:hypothetical protein
MDGFKILLAAATFGFGWFADNQNTVIAYSAVLIVWLVSVLARQSAKFEWLKGKGPLTVAVFVVSFGLSYIFHPFVISALPSWTGDAGSYVPLLAGWFEAFFSIVGTAVVFAMSIYNILLAKVLEKLPEITSQSLRFIGLKK